MKYSDRKIYDAAIEYYKRKAMIAERRLEKERREYHDRLHDRLFIICLIVAAGIFVTFALYALASFSHWAQYGC
jgi:hypothetical protein